MKKIAHPSFAPLLSWVHAVGSVLGARGLAYAAAFIANMLVARQLGPPVFARFYMLFTIMTLVAGLTGPAIDTSLVRFAAKRIGPGKDDSLPFFKAVLLLKLAIFGLTLLAGFLAAPAIRNAFFRPEGLGSVPNHAISLAFAGGGAVALWGFGQAYFQSHQQFGRYAFLEFLSSALRLGLVMALLLIGQVAVLPYFAAYAVIPAIMAAITWPQLPRAVFSAKTSLSVAREFFGFATWVLLASLCTTAAQRLDLLLLGYFNVHKEIVGRYGAAVTLVLVGELFLITFYTVLLPRASQLHGPPALRNFMAQVRLPSLLLCLAMSLMIPLATFMRWITLGAEYHGTEAYFVILLLGVIISVAAAPAVPCLYSLGRAKQVAGFEFARLALTLAFGLWTVPRYGVHGMAWTMAGVRAAIGTATYLATFWQLRRAAGNADSHA